MAGPWRHPNGIWYYRKELPGDLWEARERLAQLGIRIGGKEVRRSLSTRDRPAAEDRYRELSSQQETSWAAWRDALENGPAALSERQVAAIAGTLAKAHLRRHEENPSQGIEPPTHPAPAVSTDLLARVEALKPYDQQRLRAQLEAALSDLDRADMPRLLAQMEAWNKDPALSIISRAIIEPLVNILVVDHGADLADALQTQGIVPDTSSQAALLVQSARLQARARDTLRTMATSLDYREPDWAKGIPDIARPAAKVRSFKDIIDEEAKRRGLGRDSVPMREKTISKYRSICAEFARFRGKGGTDPATITADELERWKTKLLSAGKVGNRTVGHKLGAIKTVVRWAQRLHRGEFKKAAADVAEVLLPGFTPKPSDKSAVHPDEATVILKAARQETEMRRRWLPWLCAYTGLRISEASRLETGDFFESEGHWFFEVSLSGKRSLKTVNARRTIPVHRALLEEGFRKFVESAPKGRLFGTGASNVIQRWVRSDAVGIVRPELSPNHGWRHLFEDLCRRYELTDDARLYLAGHSTGGADQGYGRTRAMLPGLWRQVEKIEPFKLNETMPTG